MSERYTETASAETARSDAAATSLPFTAGENGSYTRFIQCYLEDKERLDQYLFLLVNIGARNNVNIDDFVDEIEVHQDYFVWRLNISPDDAIMKVSGRVNNYTVSQTDRSSLGIYSNGNKAVLANIYSEDEQLRRQQLPTNNTILGITNRI